MPIVRSSNLAVFEQRAARLKRRLKAPEVERDSVTLARAVPRKNGLPFDFYLHTFGIQSGVLAERISSHISANEESIRSSWFDGWDVIAVTALRLQRVSDLLSSPKHKGTTDPDLANLMADLHETKFSLGEVLRDGTTSPDLYVFCMEVKNVLVFIEELYEFR